MIMDEQSEHNQEPTSTINEQYRERTVHIEEKRSFIKKFKNFIKECRRVLKITKKPTGDEFKTIVKASGLGLLIIGAIGFVLTMIKNLIL